MSTRRKTFLWVVGGIVVLLLVVGALGGDSDQSSPAASATPQPAKTPTPEVELSKVDRPTPPERLKLERRLYAIDARMKAKPDRYVERAVSTCDAIHRGIAGTKLLDQTVYRFYGGTMPDFSEPQARRVLVAVRETFCD